MGFRTTMMSEDYSGQELPDWFVQKYKDEFYFGGETAGLYLTSKHERKWYIPIKEEEVLLDIQKILVEKDIRSISCVLLHECGGITLVFVSKNDIRAREPVEWKEVERVEHNYCYGCSEPNNPYKLM